MRSTGCLILLIVAAFAAGPAPATKPAAPAAANAGPAAEKDPTANPNAVVVPVEQKGGSAIATVGGKSFDLSKDDQRAAMKAALADARQQKIKAGAKAADVQAVLRADRVVSSKDMTEADKVCPSAGFQHVDRGAAPAPKVAVVDKPKMVEVAPDGEGVIGLGNGGIVQDDPPADPATAKSIVFVCNGSASMKSKFASVKQQLVSAVNHLGPEQQFDVVFWQDGKAVAFQPAGMVPASVENRGKCVAFLDKVPAAGKDDPAAALSLALRLKPELLFLTTDGDFPDNKAVLGLVRKGNADKKVRISTIAFVNDKDTDTEFIEVLQTIAKENRGTFRHVAANELREEAPTGAPVRPRP